MTQLTKIGIGVAVFILLIAGSIVYSIYQINKSYDNGYSAGQASVTITTKVETKIIHDTIRVKEKTPVKHPITQKDTSAVNNLVGKLKTDNDSLKNFIVDRLSPKSFFIADPHAYAVVNYDPIKDEYDGYIAYETEVNETSSTKEIPCPPVPPKEAWYEDSAMYIAGGASGIVVIASGGTALLGLGVTVGVGALIAVF